MKKIKNLSTAGTVVCLISLAIYIAIILILYFGVTDMFLGFAGDSMGKLDGVDSNSPSAGFEVLAYLSGGALGFLGGLISLVFAIFLGFLSVYQVPAIIAGFIANVSYKKNQDMVKVLKTYKVDGFIKAIMNGIVLAFVLLLILSDLDEAGIYDVLILLALVWNYITVFVLSVIQIVSIKKEVNAIK